MSKNVLTMKNRLINIYKNVKDLEVKQKLLHLLNDKFLSLGLGDADTKTEDILNSIAHCDELNNNKGNRSLIMRYGRNYCSVKFELKE